MPREKADPERDAAWLMDMLTAAQAVGTFLNGRNFDEYQADLLLRSAVERQIEIIGEAVRNLSEEFKSAQSDVPWRAIRHRLHTSTGESTTRSSGPLQPCTSRNSLFS
jgi:uncharacterized protein with HEPN domain